jgi:hypothetical protein
LASSRNRASAATVHDDDGDLRLAIGQHNGPGVELVERIGLELLGEIAGNDWGTQWV